MDRDAYKRVMADLSKANLKGAVDDVMDAAEDAWKAQQDAIRLIDHKSDEVKGEKRLKDLVHSLDDWIENLETLANGAQKVTKRANQALHAGGRHFRDEEDGEGHSSYAGSRQAARQTARCLTRRRRSRNRRCW